jgi:cytidylate kinase
MSIITISRGSYSHGRDVAEKVSQRLGYACISREILISASEEFNIPEIKLMRAVHDAPSILERFTYGKERYVAYLKAALMKHIQKDNVVYHGLAGHFFLQGVPHVLKVRILADLEDRVAEEMRRVAIPAAKARDLIKKDDEERRKWSLQLYGADPWDPMLYDLVIHLNTITVADAVDLISQAVKLPGFQTTPRSQALLDDLALSAQIQAVLVEQFPDVRYRAKDGEVVVNIKGVTDQEELAAQVKRIVKRTVGVEVEVKVIIGPEIAID